MKPSVKTILKWSAACLLFLAVLVALLSAVFPDTQTHARKTKARVMIAEFDAALRAYKTEYGVFPTGGNREIVVALSGHNPRSILFMEFSEADLNQKGEVTDPWQTPFKFARVSDGQRPVISSAGPDKMFNTRDDVAPETSSSKSAAVTP